MVLQPIVTNIEHIHIVNSLGEIASGDRMPPDIDPTELLYKVLGELPTSLQQSAIARASLAVGLYAPPTGLKGTPDRSWRELHWDLRISDLRQHLTRFIQATRCDSQQLVQSILDLLESFFRATSVQEGADQFKMDLRQSIKQLDEDQARPADARISMLTHDEISALIEKLEDALDKADGLCHDAKEAVLIVESAQSRIASS